MDMPWFPLTRCGGLLALALLAASAATPAATLSPGDEVVYWETFTGERPTPTTSLASDPSLAGTVVASQSVPYAIPVAWTDVWSDDVYWSTSAGYIDDWVVRRNDNGLLDFYAQLRTGGGWGGWFTREWMMGGASTMDVGVRDDLPLMGNVPTWIGLADDGRTVTTDYYVTDDGYPNLVRVSAPVLMRSSSGDFHLAEGKIAFSGGTAFSSSFGSIPIMLYAPVPEPSMALLLLAGVALLRARFSRRAPSATQ